MWRSPRRLVQTGSAALWCRPKKCFRPDLIDGCHSYLDLGAELYDAVRRDAEELSRACCDAHEAGIDVLAPSCHPRARARFDIGAPDKERKLTRVELEAGDFGATELAGNVWRLGKPEMGLDLPKPASEITCLDPICAGDSGYVLGDDPNQQDRPMQDLIVLEVVQQGRWHICGLRRQVDRGARDASFRRLLTSGKERS